MPPGRPLGLEAHCSCVGHVSSTYRGYEYCQGGREARYGTAHEGDGCLGGKQSDGAIDARKGVSLGTFVQNCSPLTGRGKSNPAFGTAFHVNQSHNCLRGKGRCGPAAGLVPQALRIVVKRACSRKTAPLSYFGGMRSSSSKSMSSSQCSLQSRQAEAQARGRHASCVRPDSTGVPPPLHRLSAPCPPATPATPTVPGSLDAFEVARPHHRHHAVTVQRQLAKHKHLGAGQRQRCAQAAPTFQLPS